MLGKLTRYFNDWKQMLEQRSLNVRYGSVAAIQTHSGQMSAIEGKAVILILN